MTNDQRPTTIDHRLLSLQVKIDDVGASAQPGDPVADERLPACGIGRDEALILIAADAEVLPHHLAQVAIVESGARERVVEALAGREPPADDLNFLSDGFRR